MKTALIFIVLLFSFNYAFGQTSKVPGYKIRASKRLVSVTFQKKTHALDMSEQIDAARITDSELLFAREKEGFRYLVFNVSGWSRDKQNDRQCGAGTESNLIWVKLDAAWRISDVQSARYESCWSVETLIGDFNVTKDSIDIEYHIKDDKTAKLSYHAGDPEKGFRIVEAPYKN